MEVAMMNGRPLGARKKVQILVIFTLLAWATQTLLHQWGFGAEIDAAGAAQITQAADRDGSPAAQQAAERFVPAARFAPSATIELRGEASEPVGGRAIGGPDAVRVLAVVPSSTSTTRPSTRPAEPALASAAAATADVSPVRSLRDLIVADLAVRLDLPIEKLQVNFNPK